MLADARRKCRPHLLTIIVVLIVTALIVLANLSYDYGGWHERLNDKSYGWPLIWHRYVIAVTGYYEASTVGWYFSAGRFAMNALLWLAMLAATWFSCEWLVRRYPPRFRWSLRTMLALVGLSAAFFAWLAPALDRAKVQDGLTGTSPEMWFFRSGYCVERWGPGLVNLKSLTFAAPDNTTESTVHECLTAIGNAPRLEHLFLSYMKIDRESLACLGGLANLTTLSLESLKILQEPLLQHLPSLPRLEALHLSGEHVCDTDLCLLARFPNLKSLALVETSVTPGGLEALASLRYLEELALDGDLYRHELSYVAAPGLRAILPLRRLQKLHLGRHRTSGADWTEITLDDGERLRVLPDDHDAFQKASRALRKMRPGIVIDGQTHLIYRSRWDTSFSEDSCPIRPSSWLPQSDVSWMTAAKRAAFEAEGGWAGFDAAGKRNDDGRMVTVSF